MRHGKIITVLLIMVSICYCFTGCEVLDDYLGIERPTIEKETVTENEGQEEIIVNKVYETHKPEAYLEGNNEPPSDEIRNSKKEEVFKGLSDEQRKQIIIKMAKLNQTYESGYLNDNMFASYIDIESTKWNKYEDKNDEFIHDIEEIKDSLTTEILYDDLDEIIELSMKAVETHDRNILIKIHYIIHDLDYYLFRDGRAVFKEIQENSMFRVDVSTVWKYYGVLKVYERTGL